MYDRNVEFPQRYRLQKVDGTDDIFDLIPTPGEIRNEGTLINKSSLLKDATAALFGLGSDAVPDDVLALLKTITDNNGAAIANGVKIATGSYVGTGTYGPSNPCSLTFDFEPKLLIVGIPVSFPMNAEGRFQNSFIWVTGNTSLPTWANGAAPTCYITASGKTISWYTTYSKAIAQANDSGHQYTYFAAG